MLKKFLKRAILALTVAVLVLPIFGGAGSAYAAKGDHGVDWSKYQGARGTFGYPNDKFAIVQMGGTTDGYNMYDQWTYSTQVASTIAQGKRAHNYIWWQNVTSNWQADQVLDYFLPKVQTPKGSIIALDVESGAQNTYAIQHACDRIKAAGYLPMVYGYKNYLQTHTDLNYLADREQLWLTEYPNYAVTPNPNYGVFPSFKNIGIFQFTSTYIAGGLDGDIDLTGITDSGYKNGDAQKPVTQTPAVKQGQQIHKETHNYTVKPNDSWWAIANRYGMSMYTLAQINGATVNTVIHPGQVLRVADNGQGQEVANQVSQPVAQPQGQYYTVQYGDSFWSIANKHRMNMYTLAANNGLSINSVIYPGQRLRVNGRVSQPAQRVHYVRYGETLSGIATSMNTTVGHLQTVNGIRNANFIYVGQRIAA